MRTNVVVKTWSYGTLPVLLHQAVSTDHRPVAGGDRGMLVKKEKSGKRPALYHMCRPKACTRCDRDNVKQSLHHLSSHRRLFESSEAVTCSTSRAVTKSSRATTAKEPYWGSNNRSHSLCIACIVQPRQRREELPCDDDDDQRTTSSPSPSPVHEYLHILCSWRIFHLNLFVGELVKAAIVPLPQRQDILTLERCETAFLPALPVLSTSRTPRTRSLHHAPYEEPHLEHTTVCGSD